MAYARWSSLFIFLFAANLHADEWPVARGKSREPTPYRYDAKVLKTIPKEFLDDSTACVLYSGTSYLIEPDGTVESISHEITRLNSRKGIDKLGEYRSIYYDPTFEKLTLNEARVIKADGTIVLIEPKHVQLRDVATDFQVYDQSKQLVISFPNLVVGDSYEVKWTVRGRNKEFAGDFFSRYSFGDDTHPVLLDELRVRVPKNKTLKYASINGKVEPTITDTGGEKLYHFRVTNKAELPRDEERPSREELRLQVAVSTFASWDAVGTWKQKLRADCWNCTPEVRKIVDDVTRGLTTQEAKAKALTYWVRRNIRYLSRGPGGLGYTPHAPQQVMGNLYGDCKDQAQLLAVMLREIGLPVWLVTLGALDDGQVEPAVPSPWGSHAILLTKIDGKDHWIDTTVSLAAWNYLPRADRDRLCYLTQEDKLTMLRTPPFTYADYRIEQTTHVSVQPDGTSRCKRESAYHASSAWSRRDRWLEVPPGERRRTIAAELQDSHSKARLLSFKIDEKQLREFDKPVRIDTDYEIPRHFSDDATREASFTDSPVYTWFLGYNIDVERRLPFVLPTHFESVHRYIIQLPPAYRLDGVPTSKEVASRWGFFKLKIVHDTKDPRRVEMYMQMRLEKTRVEKSEFAEFIQFQDDVTRAYRVWVYLRPSAEIADAPALEQILAAKKPAESHTVKVLARLYLDYDRHDDARRVLDKAAAMFPDDKGLWELRVQASKNQADEEQLYRAMVKQFPKEAKYALALGAACVRRGNHAEAIKMLTPLTDLAHTAAVRGAAHYQLARSVDRQGQAEAALKHLRAALIADPPALATNDAMNFKALVHEKLGQTKEAIQSLQAVIDTDPNARESMEHLIRIELKAGMRDAALDTLRRLTVAAGKNGASLVKAAELHLELDRYEDAFEVAKRVPEGDFRAKADRVLGLVHLRKHEYQQAAAHLDRGTVDAKSLVGGIRAHLFLGDLDAAARRVESIRSLEEPGKELLVLEKDVAQLAERREKYLAQWNVPKVQQAVATRVVSRYLCAERGLAERWPRGQVDRLLTDMDGLEFAPLLALRAWQAIEKGQLRKAVADADAALKLAPGEARAYLVRGRARLEQGNADAAVLDLRRATELSGRQDPQVLHWFAAAMFDLGRTKEAVETQRLALLLRPDDVELREQLRRMEKR